MPATTRHAAWVNNGSDVSDVCPTTTVLAKSRVVRETYQNYVVGSVLVLITLITLLGNALVCVIILTDRHMKRKVTCLLFVTLAVSDLFLAVFVMPFSIVNDVHGKWIFGDEFCLVWICFDIMFCTASILNLCLICVDRYIRVKHPLQYQANVTPRLAMVLVAVAWCVSGLTSVGFTWGRWDEPEPKYDPDICVLGFKFTYAITSAFISFYIPGLILVVLYLRTLRIAHSLLRCASISQRGEGIRQVAPEMPVSGTRQVKLVVTVGLVVGVFLLCWLPFFIVSPVAGACHTCISRATFFAFTWLGYSSSCVNPFIYDFFHDGFRRAVRRSVRCLFPEK